MTSVIALTREPLVARVGRRKLACDHREDPFHFRAKAKEHGNGHDGEEGQNQRVLDQGLTTTITTSAWEGGLAIHVSHIGLQPGNP